MKRTLYGDDGTGGVVGCLKDKVPKKWLWIAMGMLFLPTVGFTGSIWYKTKASDLKYATLKQVRQHETRVQVLEKTCDDIKETLRRIETNQAELRQDVKLLIRGVNSRECRND